MAAPTGNLDSEILSRLEQMLGDTPESDAPPEDTQAIKPKVNPPALQEVPQPVLEPEEDEPAAAESAEPAIEPEGEAAEKDDPDAIRTLTDLARMFEVDEADMLRHLEVDAGDGKSVSLDKVLESYRKAPDAVRRAEDLQRQEQLFQAEAAQMRAKTDAHVRELAVHTQTILDITQSEFKDIDWKRLEIEDPQQFIILKHKQGERSQLIHGAIEKLRAIEQDRNLDAQKGNQAFRQQEIATLHTKMPDWKKPEVAQVAMSETKTFLESAGFSDQEISSITDHRYLLVAYEAAQFRKLKSQAPKKLEKLRSLPKPKAVLRSTARRDASTDTRRNAQKKLDRLKQTGDERDAARIFEELL